MHFRAKLSRNKDNSKINWNITVEEGQKIQLTIHLMNVRIILPSMTAVYGRLMFSLSD